MRPSTLIAASIAALLAAWLALTSRCPQLTSVADSVVVLTGASQGIGAELAVQYGRLGAHLVLAARRRAQLEEVSAAALAAGARSVKIVAADMSKVADVSAVIEAAASFGHIDVLMLNHAAVDDALVVEYNNTSDMTAAISAVLNANVLGSASATHAAMQLLSKAPGGGHVAVISSASTVTPAPFHSAYVASKRALHGWFETLRHELHLTGSPVTIGIQVLGMIGTPAVMKDPGNARLAISVEDCAAGMICAAAARWCVTPALLWSSNQCSPPLLLASSLLSAAHLMSFTYSQGDSIRAAVVRLGDSTAAALSLVDE